MNNYAHFVSTKIKQPDIFGHEPGPLHESLFDFQVAVTRWAIRRGRAAVFMDCGLGKTRCQLEWARQSGERVLIFAPLAVAEQTIAEGRVINVDVRKVARPDDGRGIQITNYEKIEHFIGAPYDALVCDESGILKSLDGKTRTMLLREFTSIPRRLACTATPAPNDLSELANHAEFLGVMSRVEMLATFFVHDSDQSGDGGWRLKGHAQDAFWEWVSKWAIYARMPSDLGFEDGAFTLPELTIRQETVQADWKPDGMLFSAGLGGIGDRREARRATLAERVARAVEVIKNSPEQWLVWCGLNDEGDAIEKALGDECVQIAGKDGDEAKIAKEWQWRSGAARVMITKSKIFGHGLNWQHCHKMMFLGLGDSWEQYYQSMRREWRFGQLSPVEVVVVVSDAEQSIVDNIRRKEEDAARLAAGIIQHAKTSMQAEVRGAEKPQETYNATKTMKLPAWAREVRE